MTGDRIAGVAASLFLIYGAVSAQAAQRGQSLLAKVGKGNRINRNPASEVMSGQTFSYATQYVNTGAGLGSPASYSSDTASSSPRMLSRNILRIFTLDRYDVVFFALMLLLGFLAFRTMTATPSVMGGDVGNYLLTMRRVFGDDPTGIGLQRPPLIAIPLKIATMLLPTVTATKVVAVLAWLFYGFTGYRLFKAVAGGGLEGNLAAILAGVGYLLAHRVGTMALWGFITIVGIALTNIVLLLVIRGMKSPTWKSALLVALSIALLAGTHQVSLFIALWILAGYTALLVALRKWDNLLFLVKSGALALVFSAWLIPLYISIVNNAAGESTEPGLKSIGQITSNILPRFFALPDTKYWITVFIGAVIGLALLLIDDKRRSTALVLGSMFVMTSLLMLAPGVWGSRAPYFIYLPMFALACSALAAGLRQLPGIVNLISKNYTALDRNIPSKALTAFVSVFLVIALIFVQGSFQKTFASGVKYWSVIDQEHLQTIDFIQETTPEAATFIAHPRFLGWWLEGALGRNAYEVGRFTSEQQNQQSLIAEYVLAGNHVISNGAFMVGHSFPDDGPGTPQIWLTPDDKTTERVIHASLDDGAAIMAVSDASGLTREIALGDLAQSFNINRTTDWISLSNVFTGVADGTVVYQQTSLARNLNLTRIQYTFDDAKRRIQEVSIPLQLFNLTEIEHIEGGPSFRALQSQPGKVETLVGVKATNALVETVLQLPGKSSEGAVTFAQNPVEPGYALVKISPEASRFSVVIEITASVNGSTAAGMVSVAEAEEEDSGLLYVHASDLAAEHRIGYVAVSGLQQAVIERLNGSPAYKLLQQNGEASVYQIDPESFDLGFTKTASADALASLQEAQPSGSGLDVLLNWNTMRANNLRMVSLSSSGSNVDAIAADVRIEPGKWSGIAFDAPGLLDWSEVKDLSVQMRWASLEGLTPSLTLVDTSDRRWAWRHSQQDVVSQVEDGWYLWDLRKETASRQDEGFAWNEISQVMITALGESDETFDNTLELMPFNTDVGDTDGSE